MSSTPESNSLETTTPVLEARKVSKQFVAGKRTAQALREVSLDVQPGRVTGLIGPDGAGKTTLMRLAVGLLAPDDGEIRTLGFDATRESLAVQANVRYMPQRFGLYEDLSVQENLDLYADLQGVLQSERPGRYEELMRMTGLARFTGRLAGRLSGGMKQKLGLACTLVRPPRLLLLDEPTVGVDPVSRRELWQIVYRLVRQEGVTVLLSTAYLDEAERCEEVLLMHEGELVGHGSPRQFCEQARGRTYLVSAPGRRKRTVQAQLAAAASVADALIQGERVRLVMDSETPPDLAALLPDLPGAKLQPTAPRLEDTFVTLLRKRQSGLEPGAFRQHHHPERMAITRPRVARHELPWEDPSKTMFYAERISRPSRPRIVPLNPSPALKGTLSPSEGEREGVRGLSGELGFMGRVTSSSDRVGGSVEMRSAGPVIQVRDVKRRFGDFYAVKGVTFEVGRGEIFGLLGANGAGKSTTFRMLCGLLPATEGVLLVAGLDLRHAAAVARARIGYMSQKFSLYGNLSVSENLRFFSSAYGLSGSRQRDRIDWALTQFELGPIADTNSIDLPLGHKQRLAMACALMHEPEILFLDEPTSGVDPLARREFWGHINSLAEQNVTVMVTTHFMEEAEYCDRLAIMADGEILALGTPEEIKQRRRTEGHPEPTMEEAFIGLIESKPAPPEAV